MTILELLFILLKQDLPKQPEMRERALRELREAAELAKEISK